jgi:hypothetical protein
MATDDTADRFSMIELDSVPNTKPATAPKAAAPVVTPRPAPVSPLATGTDMLRAATTIEALDAAAQKVAALCLANGLADKDHPTRVALRDVFKTRRADLQRQAFVAMFALLWVRIWATLADAIEERPSLVRRPALAPVAVDTTVPAPTGDALVDTLQGIGHEASSNAAVQGAGSMAGGQLRGVGFSTAAGYVTALANGVKQATADSYKSTLRGSYGYTEAQIAALVVTVIPEAAALPVGPGIVHRVTSGKSVDQMTPAEVKAHWAKPIVSGETETMRSVRDAMRSGEIMAVAGAVSSGVAIAWDGLGEFKRSEMLAVLAEAKLPEAWVKAPTSPKALAGLVVTGENRHGLIAKPERMVKGQRKHRVVMIDGMPRSYLSRWTIQQPSHGEVGEHAGTILATATVWVDGSITVEGDENIRARVETEYNRRRDEEVYEAGQVTAWLQEIITGQWHGIKHYGWYIPAKHAAAAQRLYDAVERKWGRWRVPMPMVTCDALRAGLTKSLADEVNAVLADIETEHQAGLKASPKRSQLTPARAAAFLAQLSELGARASKHAEVLGGTYAAKVRDGIAVAMESLRGLCSDGDLRASLLELDVLAPKA